MIVISANHLSRVYGIDEIFSNVSFHVNQGDRIGIVGTNGAGKSTLLDLLSGEQTPDEGNCYIASDLKVGYFKQNDLFTSEKTVYEEMLAIFSDLIDMEARITELSEEISRHSSENGEDDQLNRLLAEYDRLTAEYEHRNGYGYKSEIQGVLNSMAFPPSFFEKKTNSLSGGERTRLALAALLLQKPDILLLDEPTNHLDIGTLKWLEQYIRGYPGTVLIVSHDRYFLDHVTNRTFEMENHRLSVYEGSYSFYAAEKKNRLLSELKAYEKQQTEIRRQEEMIRRFKERGTEKLARRARSREKQLEKIDRLDRPVTSVSKMVIRFKEETKSGNDALEAKDLGKCYGTGKDRRVLFSQVHFDIKRGERICIIGPNGIGKTTLLKIMMQEEEPDEGYLRIGHNVVFGYYDQEQTMLSDSSTILEEMRDSYSLYDDNELRGFLGRFLFKGEDVHKKVGALSGGERARLALLKLMLSGANTLILDEPTNHLDILSKEVFEDALLEFPGTAVIVSHDRYLLNKVPTSIYELNRDGITIYPGNYDYYNEKKAQLSSASAYMNRLHYNNTTDADREKNQAESGRVDSREERRRQKELQAEQRRKDRKIAALEQTISELEEEIASLETALFQEEISSDLEKLTACSNELAGKKEALDQAYEEWERLAEDAL